jgi:L-fuculose-phosphate aldolase
MNKNLIFAAQSDICAAGLRLVKEGLVARTWGNISIRIDEQTMAITPSGVKYEDVRPEHIVIINLNDGSYEGDVKPSGERKLHMEIYKNQPGSGAIIHTHQLNASVCSAARKDVPVVSAAERKILSTEIVRCGAYGLPGTGKLTSETVKAAGGSRCALMANHGAVCIGKDIDEAFTVSRALEKVCEEFIGKCFMDVTGLKNADDKTICGHYEMQYGMR